VGVVRIWTSGNIIPQRNLTIYEPFAQGRYSALAWLYARKNDPYALVTTITKNHSRCGCYPNPSSTPHLDDVRTEFWHNRVNASCSAVRCPRASDP